MIHEHSQWIERLAYVCAGIAVVSLSQVALVLTCTSAALAIILGAIRLHDRLKYGPQRGKE